MKKIYLLVITLTMLTLTACGGKQTVTQSTEENAQPNVTNSVSIPQPPISHSKSPKASFREPKFSQPQLPKASFQEPKFSQPQLPKATFSSPKFSQPQLPKASSSGSKFSQPKLPTMKFHS